ncbi:MAG: hypothetical protein ABL933_15930 [Methyloglobulus sp.]
MPLLAQASWGELEDIASQRSTPAFIAFKVKTPGSISESTSDCSDNIHRPIPGKTLTKWSEPIFTASGDRYGYAAFLVLAPDQEAPTLPISKTPYPQLNRRVALQPA